MPYSSVWTRLPLAVVASMIGSIVVCCTLASMESTTGPPRSIRPRMGGLSFSSVPRPGARRPACVDVRAAPFGHGRGLALVPGHHVDLIDLHLAFQPHLGSLGDQTAAQLFGHGLHVGRAQA